MSQQWLKWLLIPVGGGLITLTEAAGRFGWLGSSSELAFPPELLALWLFSIIPMNLFTLGVSTLGKAAKWYAFGGMTAFWTVLVGAVLYAGVRTFKASGFAATTRAGTSLTWIVPGLGLALVVEPLWVLASTGAGMVHQPLSIPVIVPTAGAYLLAARLFDRLCLHTRYEEQKNTNSNNPDGNGKSVT